MKKIAFSIVAFIVFVIIMTLISLKFFNNFNDNISPQSIYKNEIEILQKEVQTQLDAVKKLNLSNEKVELVIFNAFLASIRLSEARSYIENYNLVDGHYRLMSARNYLNENKTILRSGGET